MDSPFLTEGLKYHFKAGKRTAMARNKNISSHYYHINTKLCLKGCFCFVISDQIYCNKQCKIKKTKQKIEIKSFIHEKKYFLLLYEQ